MQAPGSAPPGLPSGFDAESSAYEAHWDDDPVGRLQRRRVHALLDAVVPCGARVLDIGCGTGTDAQHLTRRGCDVVGFDPSPAMVAKARRRCPTARFEIAAATSPPGGAFDAALSNFGALNGCEDLRPVATPLADRLVASAPFVLVLLAPFAPVELATLVWGDWSTATRRSRPTANVGNAEVPIWYHGKRAVLDAFGGAFRVETRHSIGVALPRAGSRFAAFANAFDPLDRVLGSMSGVRRCGDHVVYVLRRR